MSSILRTVITATTLVGTVAQYSIDYDTGYPTTGGEHYGRADYWVGSEVGPICNDYQGGGSSSTSGWNENAATVFCNEMGTDYQLTAWSAGTGAPVASSGTDYSLFDLKCDGDEDELTDCEYATSSTHCDDTLHIVYDSYIECTYNSMSWTPPRGNLDSAEILGLVLGIVAAVAILFVIAYFVSRVTERANLEKEQSTLEERPVVVPIERPPLLSPNMHIIRAGFTPTVTPTGSPRRNHVRHSPNVIEV